jgi:DNA-binding MarR family transcriptional regulator
MDKDLARKLTSLETLKNFMSSWPDHLEARLSEFEETELKEAALVLTWAGFPVFMDFYKALMSWHGPRDEQPPDDSWPPRPSKDRLQQFFADCHSQLIALIEKTVAEAQPKAPTAPPAPGPEAEEEELPKLKENELDILAYLNEAPARLFLQIEIAINTSISEKTAGQKLHKMKKAQLVNNPAGERSGWCITPYGQAVYKKATSD